jgi:molecular chaperone GrpE
MQQNDLKNDGEVMEEEIVSAAETGAGAPDEDSGAIGEDSAAPQTAEKPHSVENAGSESDNLPDTAQLNAKSAELEAKSEDLAAQLADSRDQLLRKAADVENFRKRMNQEKQNAIDFANQSLLMDIIPVIDDFERAIQSAEASAELAALPAGKVMLDGIAMIEKRLINQLESKWGLKRFDSVGEPFDPNRHEAVMMEKSPDVQEPVVKEDFVKGYTLKDRVIRAAQVKILMPEGEGTRD